MLATVQQKNRCSPCSRSVCRFRAWLSGQRLIISSSHDDFILKPYMMELSYINVYHHPIISSHKIFSDYHLLSYHLFLYHVISSFTPPFFMLTSRTHFLFSSPAEPASPRTHRNGSVSSLMSGKPKRVFGTMGP